MQILKNPNLWLGGLALTISLQPVHFPDKGILACCYILVFALSAHYGKYLAHCQYYLLAGIYWSAIIIALTGLMGWIGWIIHPQDGTLGMAGIIGQKNLFANWIACGLLAGIWMKQNKYAIMFMLFILMLSGSKTVILYIPILLYIYLNDRIYNNQTSLL